MDAIRFEQEAQALATIHVPGIVRYVSRGTTETGMPFLAMQWLAGETLTDPIKRERFNVTDAVNLLARVATTLGAIHRLGIVHRDIKPSNIMR